ncbi:hypothetical protein A2U01_0107009, partial [Trifolium medium]|nr:hypothetical protein [Trifolium medium]
NNTPPYPSYTHHRDVYHIQDKVGGFGMIELVSLC